MFFIWISLLRPSERIVSLLLCCSSWLRAGCWVPLGQGGMLRYSQSEARRRWPPALRCQLTTAAGGYRYVDLTAGDWSWLPKQCIAKNRRCDGTCTQIVVVHDWMSRLGLIILMEMDDHPGALSLSLAQLSLVMFSPF